MGAHVRPIGSSFQKSHYPAAAEPQQTAVLRSSRLPLLPEPVLSLTQEFKVRFASFTDLFDGSDGLILHLCCMRAPNTKPSCNELPARRFVTLSESHVRL
jgi:hypothetical protein